VKSLQRLRQRGATAQRRVIRVRRLGELLRRDFLALGDTELAMERARVLDCAFDPAARLALVYVAANLLGL